MKLKLAQMYEKVRFSKCSFSTVAVVTMEAESWDSAIMITEEMLKDLRLMKERESTKPDGKFNNITYSHYMVAQKD